MSVARERRRARGWGLQILYAWESRGLDAPADAVVAEFLAERRVAEASRDYLRRLVDAVARNRAAIDAMLQDALTNWRLERLSAIDRNILRLAAAELAFLPDVPPRVSIQEAILLAEKYGTAESPRFVNGVLDAVMRQLEAAPPRGGGEAGAGGGH